MGRSGREEAIHLPVVELFTDEPAAIDGVLIIPLVDVYPAGSYDLPFAFKGLMPGYLIIYPLIAEACDLLRAGLDDLARVELDAREIIISEG